MFVSSFTLILNATFLASLDAHSSSWTIYLNFLSSLTYSMQLWIVVVIFEWDKLKPSSCASFLDQLSLTHSFIWLCLSIVGFIHTEIRASTSFKNKLYAVCGCLFLYIIKMHSSFGLIKSYAYGWYFTLLCSFPSLARPKVQINQLYDLGFTFCTPWKINIIWAVWNRTQFLKTDQLID